MLNPPEESRLYSEILGDNKPAFGMSMLESARLWRWSKSGVWLQIKVGESPLPVTGVAIKPGAIWSGAMFVTTFAVKTCSSVDDASGNCTAWADARNDEGGLTFDGPPNKGDKASDGKAVPPGGANHLVRAFFESPVVTQYVRIYPKTCGPWICGLRAGLLVYDDLPPPGLPP